MTAVPAPRTPRPTQQFAQQQAQQRRRQWQDAVRRAEPHRPIIGSQQHAIITARFPHRGQR